MVSMYFLLATSVGSHPHGRRIPLTRSAPIRLPHFVLSVNSFCLSTSRRLAQRERNTHRSRRVCAIGVKSGCCLAGRQPKDATWCRHRCAGREEYLPLTSRSLWGPGCRQYGTRALAPSPICWQTPAAFWFLCRRGQRNSPRRAKRSLAARGRNIPSRPAGRNAIPC